MTQQLQYVSYEGVPGKTGYSQVLCASQGSEVNLGQTSTLRHYLCLHP